MSNPRDPFVPLTAHSPAAPRTGDSTVVVLAQAANAQPFRPLGEPKGPSAPGPVNGNCEARISLQREGDRVSSIQVHCACGHVIELACVYDAPGSAQ